MNKVIALALVIVMAICLSACGASAQNSEPEVEMLEQYMCTDEYAYHCMPTFKNNSSFPIDAKITILGKDENGTILDVWENTILSIAPGEIGRTTAMIMADDVPSQLYWDVSGEYSKSSSKNISPQFDVQKHTNGSTITYEITNKSDIQATYTIYTMAYKGDTLAYIRASGLTIDPGKTDYMQEVFRGEIDRTEYFVHTYVKP